MQKTQNQRRSTEIGARGARGSPAVAPSIRPVGPNPEPPDEREQNADEVRAVPTKSVRASIAAVGYMCLNR